MKAITLQELLEAGCHFGHKSERWHPHAQEFIFTEKDGIHIIDLVKTKSGLEAASEFVKKIVRDGGSVLFVATKRQARGVVKDQAQRAGAPYFTARWIGGFLTNWDAIKKNVDKLNRMQTEKKNGDWKKYPKHEQAKLERLLKKINIFYEGVAAIKSQPQALFIVDIRKEVAAFREGLRQGIPIIAIVDTNSDPADVDYVIPANDDAVGSISFITKCLSDAYIEGSSLAQKSAPKDETKTDKTKTPVPVKSKEDQTGTQKPSEVKKSGTDEKIKSTPEETKKRGRPKKVEIKKES